MPEFCTCGAQLPPDARFCHKCGKPQYDYPTPEMIAGEEEPKPQPPPLPVEAALPEVSFHNRTAVRIGFAVAILATVVVIGVTAVVPSGLLMFVGFFFAGLIAALWYAKMTGKPLSLRSGARMGWITGIFQFMIFTALITAAVLGASEQGGIIEMMRKGPGGQDPRLQQLIQLVQQPGGMVSFFVAILVILFVLGTTLPMLGGALGAKLSEKKA
ncbi:MAG TPA: zinc ribbon domain-containing protein [Bryobacteraceae bacterium]|nr:zinc ribbon domain-containing protein [Bryobacteraceae bacterium]